MRATAIQSVHARQVMDAKFRPVAEVDVTLENGVTGRAAAPTGTSTGSGEAVVLRDNNPDRYCGLSVFQAVDHINNRIGPALIGRDATDQAGIDQLMIEMDGTPHKSILGGNAIYSVSLACLQAAAGAAGESLSRYICGGSVKTIPLPTANSILGGRYPDKTVAIQEFTFCPYRAASITEAMEIISRVHREIGAIITKCQNGQPARRGNAHGWMPLSEDPAESMDIMVEAVSRCGYRDKVAYALDVAASEMYDPASGTYYMNGRRLSPGEQVAYIQKLTRRYPFLFVEDVLEEGDWDGYVRASKLLDRTVLIGDDLTVTNPQLLTKASALGAVGGFVFKPNQVGTVTEAIRARRIAAEQGLITVSSQRGGGTVWDAVVELGIGLQIEATKSCAPRGGESVYAMNSIYRAEDEYPDATMFDFTPYVRF